MPLCVPGELINPGHVIQAALRGFAFLGLWLLAAGRWDMENVHCVSSPGTWPCLMERLLLPPYIPLVPQILCFFSLVFYPFYWFCGNVITLHQNLFCLILPGSACIPYSQQILTNIYPSIHSSIIPSIHSPMFHTLIFIVPPSFTYPSIHQSTHPLIHPSNLPNY